MTLIYGDVVAVINPWVAVFVASCYVPVAYFKYRSKS